jgi:hypothetical protein
MSSSEALLQLVTNWMTAISLFLLISFGLFGCICNIIIFTSKKLEKNSCAFYFLCTAVFEALILCIGGISRLATEHFGSQFLNQNPINCKIRSYLITTLGTIATYLILMAAIDRCMATSTHARYRAFSQKKIAQRVVFMLIMITAIINIHVLVFFDLRPTCIPRPGTYAMAYSLYLIILTGILPDGLILFFTIWTFKNVKQLRMRNTTNVMANSAKQKTETHLVTVSLFLIIDFYSSIILDDVYSRYYFSFIGFHSNILLLILFSDCK